MEIAILLCNYEINTIFIFAIQQKVMVMVNINLILLIITFKNI